MRPCCLLSSFVFLDAESACSTMLYMPLSLDFKAFLIHEHGVTPRHSLHGKTLIKSGERKGNPKRCYAATRPLSSDQPLQRPMKASSLACAQYAHTKEYVLCNQDIIQPRTPGAKSVGLTKHTKYAREYQRQSSAKYTFDAAAQAGIWYESGIVRFALYEMRQ